MKIVPVRDNILVEVLEEKTVGLIVKPEHYSQRARKARILAIGPEVKGYAEGDVIIIAWYVGLEVDFMEVTYSQEKIRMINASEVWGIAEE